MAYDMKRKKTFDWLVKLATRKPTHLKEAYNPYKGVVFARFGKIYAQNGYILACIEYPEYYHLGDDCWMQLGRYVDDEGKHLDNVEFFTADNAPRNDRMFENMFIKPTSLHYDVCRMFNPHLLAECMQPFKVNFISPTIAQRDAYIEFSAHNKDVSIRVLTIGERK